jgi:peptide/nickel transport system permease protein
MESAGQGHRGELQRRLAHLDLYYHVLLLMGQKLASSADASSRDLPRALYERSLQLGEDCESALRNLREGLDSEDRRACESAANRVELAVERASRARGHTTFMVNIWRVLDAVEHFLENVAVKYGYAPLSDRTALERATSLEAGGAPFTPSSWVYERVRTAKREIAEPISIPVLRTFPRWRARRLLNPGLLLGVVLVLGFVAVAIAAPIIAPPQGDDAYTMPRSSFRVKPEPPGPGHLLGTTEGSYDVFHGLVWGTHIAFRIGLSVTAARLIIGLAVGLVSGYAGGWLDALMMRATDAFLAFPIVPATLLMLVFFGPTGLSQFAAASGVDSIIILSLILFGWMQYARLVRGNVLLERSKQYVEAAVAVGARAPRIIWRHVLPNIPQGLFVLAASDIGAMVVLGAVFTFLGLSGRAGLADWGWMLNSGRNWIVGTPTDAFQYWYTYLPPMAAIVLFSTGWSLIGDGLRDAADPRL